MAVLKNKYFYLPFLAVIVVSLLFLVSQIPIVKVAPKNLPVGIVNEDNGEMGNNIYQSLLENAPDAINFIEYDSISEIEEGMDAREIYGGFVIPNHFSGQIASLQTETPESAVLKIYLNEGHNSTVAATLETMLTSISATIGTNMGNEILQNMNEVSVEMGEAVSEQLLTLQSMVDGQLLAPEIKQQLEHISTMISPLKPNQAQLLSNPIQTEVIKVNKVGDLGAVPSALFIAVWVSSLLGALLLYFAGNKQTFTNHKSKYIFQTAQSLLPIIFGLFSGYLITLFSVWVLGFEFESIHTVALLLSIALIGFVYLMLASLMWLKTPAIGLFGILMFFGLPLIQMAPEMIPEFYQNYVLPWLPMRFLIEGLKEVLFFDKGVMNSNTIVLLSVAGVSFILIWIKNVMIKTVED